MHKPFLVVLIALALATGPAAGAAAATIEVTTFADAVGPGDGCSLREAIMAANADAGVHECAAGDAEDVVVLAPGTYVLRVPSSAGAEGGDLDVREDLILLGNGARIEPDFSDGFHDRLFEIHNDVRFERLVLAGASSPESGGSVLVGEWGRLELDGVVFLDNSTDGAGGAVHVVEGGELFLDGVRMLRNRAQAGGGALAVENGLVEVRSRTVLAGNESPFGGALYVGPGGRVTGAALSLVNNRAQLGAGFAVDGGEVDLADSTITSNRAQWGAAAGSVGEGRVSLRHGAVSGNRLTGDPASVVGHCLEVELGGELILDEMRIEGNQGNVSAVSDGRILLRHSLVADNTLAGDPGILPAVGAVTGVDNSVVEIVDSTVSGNAFLRDGIAYGAVGADEIASSTITGRTVGGTWRNSILAGGCEGFYETRGYNLLVLDPDATVPCKDNAPIPHHSLLDQVADARLAPLAANGGPTRTHALLPGSPALDGGNPAGCTDPAGNPLGRDQTGEARVFPAGGRCDVGAFEHDPGRPPVGGGDDRVPADRVQW